MDSNSFDLPAPVLSDLTIIDPNNLMTTSSRDSFSEQTETVLSEFGRKRKRSHSSEDELLEQSEMDDYEAGDPMPDSTQTGILCEQSFESSVEEESDSELDSFSSNDGKPFATISGLTKHGKTFQIDFRNKNELIDYVNSNWLVDQKCKFCWNCGFKGNKPLDYIDVHLTMLATVSIRCRRLHYHVSWTSAKRCNQSGRASACSSFLHYSLTEPMAKRKRCANDSHRSWLDSIESQPTDRVTTYSNSLANHEDSNDRKEKLLKSETKSLSDQCSFESSQDNESKEDQPLLSTDSISKSNFKIIDSKSTSDSSSRGIFSWIGSFFKFN